MGGVRSSHKKLDFWNFVNFAKSLMAASWTEAGDRNLTDLVYASLPPFV